MFKKVDKKASRVKRHLRVRKKVFGTPERPRLSVYRSEKNIYAQIIDDINAVTIVSASSLEKDFSAKGGNKEGAKLVGELVAKKALEKGIKDVVFLSLIHIWSSTTTNRKRCCYNIKSSSQIQGL